MYTNGFIIGGLIVVAFTGLAVCALLYNHMKKQKAQKKDDEEYNNTPKGRLRLLLQSYDWKICQQEHERERDDYYLHLKELSENAYHYQLSDEETEKLLVLMQKHIAKVMKAYRKRLDKEAVDKRESFDNLRAIYLQE